MRTSDEIKAEIEGKFGFFPPFFEPALDTPQILENLWQQTLSAYVNNPLPSLFKEKLFAYLSRYCSVPYCIVCHSCALRPLGMTAKELLKLLETPPPTGNRESEIEKTEESTALLQSEQSLYDYAILIFLKPESAAAYRKQLRQLLGLTNYAHLVAFLGYIKMCHQWVESYPELSYKADLRAESHLTALLEEEPDLADFFADYNEKIQQEKHRRENLLAAQILELQQVQEALFESEQRFRATFEQAAVGISHVGIDGRWLRVNQKLCEIVGYTREELLKLTFQDITHPEDLEADLVLANQLLAGEIKTYSMEKRYLRKDGSIVWINLTGSIVRELGAGELGTGDKGLGTRDWGQGTGDKGLGKSPSNHQSPIPNSQSPIPNSQSPIPNSQSPIPNSQSPIPNPQSPIPNFPTPKYFIGVIEDISDRVQAEQELRESKGELQAIYDGMVDGLLITERETTKFLRANAAICNMLGYSESELLSMSVKDIHPPDQLDCIWEKFQEKEKETIRHCKNIPCLRKDGSMFFADIGSKVIIYNQIPCNIAFFRDITDRKAAEEQLTQRAEELAIANTHLEQFAYIASHDLQEPLRMVASYTQLLARRYKGKLDDDADDFISYAVEGANRMQQLIKDLLAFYQVGHRAETFEAVNCEKVLLLAIANLTAAIAESGAVVTHNPLPVLLGNATGLTQLLQNLISNAIKFSQQSPRIHIEARLGDKEWVFSVRDNGIGIDPQYAARIFVIFGRLHTKSDYPGNGIGLAICQKIVNRHQGKIWVESELGKGSTFYFTLPIIN
ncbi:MULTISPECIES: PAS domain-containing sensor histidine kinase [Cyanophyceae]|uniref:PAS domain-containing sensor histidine kinase n=1 Tax=Cyanophyceae TaxID=3028117 RepID=UPI0016822BF5|nr:PAS domain-containing sensor histidine kinase [Trichocoleus sp. FACHB-69]MBD1933925.1 PAS domain S-box protein [Trichocoleus sp. FACHB-69]